MVTKDVVTPTFWIHDASQVDLPLSYNVVDVFAICLGSTKLDPHAVPLSERNLAHCKVLDIFEVLFPVEFAEINFAFVHFSVVVLLIKGVDHVRGTDFERISVLILQVKILKSFVVCDDEMIV